MSIFDCFMCENLQIFRGVLFYRRLIFVEKSRNFLGLERSEVRCLVRDRAAVVKMVLVFEIGVQVQDMGLVRISKGLTVRLVIKRLVFIFWPERVLVCIRDVLFQLDRGAVMMGEET